jgi:hypothetical protein
VHATRAPLRDLRDDQARRGLFGEAAREQLIERWVRELVELAERVERLCHFATALRRRAWDGNVLQVEPLHGRWCAWSFPDGEVWEVEQDAGALRRASRLVVRGSVDRVEGDVGLAVSAYVPGRQDVWLPVCDARLAGHR